MSNYIVKSCLAILLFLLAYRNFFNYIKTLKTSSHGKIKTAGICLAVVISAAAAVILLTLFEFVLVMVLLAAAWFFRKRLSAFVKNILSKSHGKLRLTGVSAAAAFALWFGLALFYRTDIGMPIGVQNYLYHKYWEEFEVSGFFGATVAGHPTNQLTCCPKNGNPQTDSFNVARKNTLSIGSRLFASDNYYGVLIRDDYEKYISTFIDDYFDDFTVRVYFDSSGLGNVKYMSDEFDKTTSLMDFLSFQKNERKSEGCNFARLNIFLNNQPTIEERELIEKKVLNLFNDLCSEYTYLRIYVKIPKYSSECITVLITAESQLRGYRISDNFFKNVEEN